MLHFLSCRAERLRARSELEGREGGVHLPMVQMFRWRQMVLACRPKRSAISPTATPSLPQRFAYWSSTSEMLQAKAQFHSQSKSPMYRWSMAMPALLMAAEGSTDALADSPNHLSQVERQQGLLRWRRRRLNRLRRRELP